MVVFSLSASVRAAPAGLPRLVALFRFAVRLIRIVAFRYFYAAVQHATL